jgi:hypothetical protein
MVLAGTVGVWHYIRPNTRPTVSLSSLELSDQDNSSDVLLDQVAAPRQAEEGDAVGPWPNDKRQPRETKLWLLSR